MTGITVYQVRYQGRGIFQVPALASDQLTITLTGSNSMTRYLEERPQSGVISPGSLTLVPRGHTSQWIPDGGASDVLHLLIQPQWWQGLMEDLEPDRIQLRADFATEDPLVAQLGKALLMAAHSLGLGQQLYVQSLEQALGIHLLRHYSAQRYPQPRVASRSLKCVLDYIETHLSEDLSLQTLAACENWSMYHFARTFKTVTGQSPHQYVMGRRVERARYLLGSSSLSLNQIAADVGFASQSHMNRHFKRILGVTPKAYRVSQG